MIRIGSILRAFGILLVLSGCGDTSGTFPVSGTVTYQGEPVPRGSIGFIADYNAGNKGPQAYGAIVDGKYETPPGKGHGGGAYWVRVRGYDGVPIETPEGDMDKSGAPIFPNYEINVELKPEAEVLDIAVP